MATDGAYQSQRDDACVMVEKLDDLLEQIERYLAPRINETLVAIAQQLSPPPPPTLLDKVEENDEDGVEQADTISERGEGKPDMPARPAHALQSVSTKRNLNSRELEVLPRKRRKVDDSDDEQRKKPSASTEYCTTGEVDVNTVVAGTQREDENELGFYSTIDSGGCGQLGQQQEAPPPASSPQKKGHEELTSFPLSSIKSLEGCWAEKESSNPETDGEPVTSCSPRKRHRSASASDLKQRKRARAESDSSPSEPSSSSSSSNGSCHPPPVSDDASEDSVLQASITKEIILEELLKQRDVVVDMQESVHSVRTELKGQRWLLWYRLCCCTVVSSEKYPYNGAVRRLEAKRKYEELQKVLENTEMLHVYCTGLVERTMECLVNARQVVEGNREGNEC